MKYYRYGHCERIKVKVGDTVKKGQLIAQNGTGNGQWYVHCHVDCLTYKPVAWTEFCIGKSKQWVKEHYADIRGLEKVIMPTFDHLGYGWLADAQYAGGHAFHPGLDLNGKGSGNADLDDPIYSACDGKVVYVYSGTGRNYGWGDCIVIQEVNEAPETKLTGIDLSHWNEVTDWNKIKADFIICKCTQGVDFIDPTYQKNKEEIRKRGIKFGMYHFSDGGDVKKEAAHFLKNIGEIQPTDIIVLDWEIEHEDPALWCNIFLQIVEEKTGIKPYLYTNDARALKYGSQIPYPKWIARYKDYSGDLDCDYAPKSEWDIWQYTSRGTVDGIKGNVDMNVMKVETPKTDLQGFEIQNDGSITTSLPESSPESIPAATEESNVSTTAPAPIEFISVPIKTYTQIASEYTQPDQIIIKNTNIWQKLADALLEVLKKYRNLLR